MVNMSHRLQFGLMTCIGVTKKTFIQWVRIFIGCLYLWDAIIRM